MNNPWYEVFVDLGEDGTMTLENHDTYEDAQNWLDHYKNSCHNIYKGKPLYIDKCTLGDDGIVKHESQEVKK